ncbi:uncharacterized protein LOC123537756 [Mercenaria mercenaria]|uniref:uncharacterized protein LOC123537756 n=1 Tax=Mercenaria mercenaria TaxID=6596 RepID=UPI00234FA9D6|nr:uncharacterized protein LOC123537756 [Mercenaria mercenaria]
MTAMIEGDEVVADKSVHAVPSLGSDVDPFLPIIKGEFLTVISQVDNHRLLVENRFNIRGLVYRHHVHRADIYAHEDFFLYDFTSTMAERILSSRENGTFLIRYNSRESEKLVISAKFNSVVHYSFMKKGGGIEYDGVTYLSIPSFVNKCSNEKVPGLAGKLGKWLKQSDLNLPNVTTGNVVTLQSIQMRIVAGTIAVAIDDFPSLNVLCLQVVKKKQYTVLRSCRNPDWFIARDEFDNEGFVPGYVLDCYIPQWFHGCLEREEAERMLNKTCRDGTFLVRERLTKPGTYALSVWCPDQVVHVPLVFDHGQFTTGADPMLPKFSSLLDLVEHYKQETRFWTAKDECVRILFPLTRKETSLPEEIQKMDLESIEMYFKALKEGKEHVRDIRLMVIGHHGAGKTTLTERLMGKPFTQVGSTNGIEIHVRQCQFNLKSGIWTKQRVGSAYFDDDEAHKLRLLRLLESPGSDEESSSVIEDFRRMGSPIDPLMHRNSSADMCNNKGSKTDLSKNSSPDLSDGKKNAVYKSESHSSSSSLRLDSPSSKDVTFSLDASPTTNGDCMKTSYEIATDNNDISRYQFSEGTLRLIEHTFGRKRHESKDTKDERLGFISMWDFAGQYIFYATHQVFLSPRAVYILVLDLSKGLDHFVQDEEFPIECNDLQGQLVKDYGDFWLRSIHTFCGDVPGQPPIILVGTHRSELDCAPYEQEECAERYFEEFRKLVENSPVSNHIQPEQFAIDNTLSDEEFDKLKKAIVDVAKRQRHWNQEIPARWIPLERSLSKMRASTKIISIDDVLECNSQNEVKITDTEEILLFLRYQHAVGHLIYSEDDELSGSIVLDPQWIIDAFKSLITAKKFVKLHSPLRPLWTEMQEKAMLKDELIDGIWKVVNDGAFMKDREILLTYMEKLDIIARPKIVPEDGSVVNVDFYFVPSLLKQKGNKKIVLQMQSSNTSTPNLCFVFDEGFLPPFVFQRMLGACLSRYALFSLGKETHLYCDLGIFKLDSCHCFLFRLEDNVMKLQVINMVNEKVKPALCDKLRRFVTLQLEMELCRYQQNTPFSVCIECEEPERTTNELIDCKELLKQEKMPCYAHSRSHVISADVILQTWYPDYVDLPQGQVTQHSWIDSLPVVIRKREVTAKDLSRISQCVGFNWEFIAIELGLAQADIDQSKMDYKDRTAMQIYQTLLKWKTGEGSRANIETLVKAIQANTTVEANWEVIKNVVDKIYG